MPALTDLDVAYVSLVDRAAVRDPVQQSEAQRFLVWKRDNLTPGGSMTPEEKAALDKAQSDLKTASEQLAKAQTTNETLTARVAELEKAAGKEPEPKKIDKSELDPAVREALEKAEAEREALAERVEKAEKDAAERDTLLKTERDERLTRDYIVKAETFKALPIKPAEFGPVLKAAAEKLTKDEYEALETVLTAADEQIQKGDLFKEQGRSREGDRGDTALGRAQKAADEIRKADPKISPANALDMALTADRELQADYLAEVRR